MAQALKNINIAAFDTRISAQDKGILLRLLINFFNYAAGRISKSLQSKGGNVVTVPKGFIVEDREGPLREGELERAVSWANVIIDTLHFDK